MTQREVEEITTLKRKRILYTCDRCGKESVVSLQNCFICGKDVCVDCYRYLPDDSKMWHEYEHCCCNECWDAGKDRIAKMDASEDIFRQIFEREINSWKRDVIGVTDG